jgi:hypothetical protein
VRRRERKQQHHRVGRDSKEKGESPKSEEKGEKATASLGGPDHDSEQKGEKACRTTNHALLHRCVDVQQQGETELEAA